MRLLTILDALVFYGYRRLDLAEYEARLTKLYPVVSQGSSGNV